MEGPVSLTIATVYQKPHLNIKELSPKIGIYLPVITCDVAMVTARVACNSYL